MNYNMNMEHILNLHPEPFDLIKNNKKHIEMRLNDEKRSKIKVGDTIKFISRLDNSELIVEVTKIKKYPSFIDLYNSVDQRLLGYDSSTGNNPNDMNQYYSDESISKFGVLAIYIKLI